VSRPQAFRLGWNKLHLGSPTGRGYKGICGRIIECTEVDDDLVLYLGRDVGRAWRLEAVCLDCDRKVQQALKRRRR
jgi:hypothetical protein